MGIIQSIKSLADRLNFPTGVTGETYKGILICEENRVSPFSESNDREELEGMRLWLHEYYRKKNIKAVIFGIHTIKGPIKYAIYCNTSKARERTYDDIYKKRWFGTVQLQTA